MCMKNGIYRAYLQYKLINNHKNKNVMLEKWCKEYCKKQLCIESDRDLKQRECCLKAIKDDYENHNNTNQ